METGPVQPFDESFMARFRDQYCTWTRVADAGGRAVRVVGRSGIDGCNLDCIVDGHRNAGPGAKQVEQAASTPEATARHMGDDYRSFGYRSFCGRCNHGERIRI